MLHVYDELPKEAGSIGEMFSEGMFYGRLRFNSFGFEWEDEIDSSRESHLIGAIGGSLIYQSARLNGFSVGGGLYTTEAYGNLDDEGVLFYKAGKGLLSRYDVLTEGSRHITTLAEAYLEYSYQNTSIKAGRQIFESFLTRSNDTKMIPNTFEGLTLDSPDIYGTSFKMGYLTRQKLRDHSTFHHLLAVGDDINGTYNIFSENDDSAMHYGLTLSELEDRGIEDRLIVLQATNHSIENMTLRMNYTAVPELISSAMVQADYSFYLGGLSITPGVRVMQQFDNGAGEIGGANLKTITEGYSDPESLDTALYAARIDMVDNGSKLRLGYTKVADKGDIVAPWRGFPTAAFTRAMGQYNWNANTESYMVQIDHEFETIPEFKVISRFVIQDFDDNKPGVQADSKAFTIDLFKGIGESPLYLKTRFAHVTGDANTVVHTAEGDVTKMDPSYDEVRFEINYLF